MTLKRLVFSAILSLAMGYVAYPYFALYRLASAVSSGDAGALATLVSWDAVRDGVKEDICDTAMDLPPAASTTELRTEVRSETVLPPFGYSFVRGIAANVVDANITPEAVVSVTRSPYAAIHDGSGMTLNWAFFDTPRRFTAVFGMPGQTGPENELRIQMDFRRGTWMVTRAWLPSAMLLAANSRT